MERGAGRQRGGEEEELIEVNETGAAGQWGEAEVLALLSVWGELGAAQRSGVSSRDTFDFISEQLRGLSVLRDWRECQAQCRRLGLQGRKAEQPGTSSNYRQGAAATTDAQMTPSDWEEEEDDLTSDKEAHFSSVRLQEGGQCQPVLGSVPYAQYVGPEGGRHWTDEEVRALLCVWSDREVRQRLKGTLRNKAIFQEMARRMQRGFGVVRNWKQCRTKYKNLKYEYKTAKSAQAAAGGSGPGRYMKFFDEVEAILLDSGFDGENGDKETPKSRPELDRGAERLGPIGGQTQARVPEGDLVIEIDDDDNSEDYELETEQNHRESASHASALDPSGSEQFNVVTVSDTGRNWSDQEVRALIQVWSEESVCRQLESSTRKRDIFVQISRRLLQQGVDRDWKQCHTKYKNLKYLYRSLQRGRADGTDPRRLMRFYDEVDAILNRADSGPAIRYEEQAEAGTILAGRTVMGYEDDTEAMFVMSDRATARMGHAERTCPVNAHTTPSYDVIPGNEDKQTYTGTAETDNREDLTAKRGLKRKVLDQDPCRSMKRQDTGGSCAESIDIHFKEEEDQYIPIIEINSICSMAASVSFRQKQGCTSSSNMASKSELKLGQKLNEGKTKQIIELADESGHVLVQSKDQITAGNAARKDQMEGKAAIANRTTSCVFKLLQEAGIKTAFVRQQSETAFVAARCEMIPIEWVCRRLATGSFLKRNPGVKEGYRFSPLKMEMFFKDDANNDPQWSEEQLLEKRFCLAGLTIGRCEVDIMNRTTVAIFEILERAWATQNCTLVDMKIEFGVNMSSKEIVLADVIDNDSWRLWPAGDRSQQKDKQVYRDLKEVTPEAMQMVKKNFEWVSERVKLLLEPQASGRVVVLMGSISDLAHCEKIRKACRSYGIPCVLRVTSAHKGPDETLRIKAEYEGDGVATVFVAVAGRSNGLGPVMSGNTAYPVINCPPITPDWGAQDVWSSLRMPSGLGCSTVLSPDAAAQFAAQIFGLSNHLLWAKLRASMLNTWVSLKQADQKLQACSL